VGNGALRCWRHWSGLMSPKFFSRADFCDKVCRSRRQQQFGTQFKEQEMDVCPIFRRWRALLTS
jgi:hypothetical protein